MIIRTAMESDLEFLLKNDKHFSEHNQMVLLTGPRQVGKTTLAQSIHNSENSFYFSWDDLSETPNPVTN